MPIGIKVLKRPERRVSYVRQRRPLFRRLFGGMAEEFIGAVTEAVEARTAGGLALR